MRLVSLLLLTACVGDFNEKIFPEDPNHDYDGDGQTELEGDCDDFNPNAYVGATEVCDGADNDCNEEADESTAIDATTWYSDGDSDGWGREAVAVVACEQPAGFVAQFGDCDDNLSVVNPAMPEVCNGLDDNCDGLTDDDDPDSTGDATWYFDADRDSYGDPNITKEQCEQPAGYVLEGTDCDDADAGINPSATETCDERDNDCDGDIDDADGGVIADHVWTIDSDGDGYGDATEGAETISQCSAPEGYASTATDCNDGDANINPLAAEVCDEVDQDCDGIVDDGVQNTYFMDADGDGFGAAANVSAPIEACSVPSGYVENSDDCDDHAQTGAANNPDADEVCDGIDNNCDSLTDENTAIDAPTWYSDADADGFGTPLLTFVSCSMPANYVDNGDDCDDLRDAVNPDQMEDCSTLFDDDCSGTTNDTNAVGCDTFYQDADGDEFGDASNTACLCEANSNLGYTAQIGGDCDDTRNAVNPQQNENCTTTYDDDCDGDTNDIGASGCGYFFYDYDADEHGTTSGLCACEAIDLYTANTNDDCNDLDPLISPAATEVCDVDDVDENCDGIADMDDAVGATDWYKDGDGDQYGDSTDIKTQCDQPNGYLSISGDCDDTDPSLNPGELEHCSLDPLTNAHRDEDCSGSDNDPIDTSLSGCVVFYKDGDEDGYGIDTDSQCLCYAENNYTSVTTGDCEDSDAGISPGDAETCVTSDDEDCDGSIDEAGADNCITYFYDGDNDGYGLGTDSQCLCASDGMYRATLGGDCNDSDPLYNSGFGNCGLMGTIPKSDAGLVISGRIEDVSEQSTQFIGNFDYNNDGVSDIAVVDAG